MLGTPCGGFLAGVLRPVAKRRAEA
jgi:hypothetical protein